LKSIKPKHMKANKKKLLIWKSRFLWYFGIQFSSSQSLVKRFLIRWGWWIGRRLKYLEYLILLWICRSSSSSSVFYRYDFLVFWDIKGCNLSQLNLCWYRVCIALVGPNGVGKSPLFEIDEWRVE
jgi:hypothetical protein